VIVVGLRCLLKTDEVIEVAKEQGFPYTKGTLQKYKQNGIIDSPLFTSSEGKGGHYAYYPDYVVDELIEVYQLKAHGKSLQEIKEIMEERRPERRKQFLINLPQEEDQRSADKARRSLEERLSSSFKVFPLDEKEIKKRRDLITTRLQQLEIYNDRILQMLDMITEQVKSHVELNKSQIELLREIQ